MSFSYSAINSNRKVTLPSVESWSSNMNIIKDPPKGIFTRRKQKVGETSSLTTLTDESGDRVCEAISLYARGVNPSVSVAYSNNGTQKGPCVSNIGGQTMASLPYKVVKDGAFRPPILTQEQLLPLSRQRRINTSFYTNASKIDFSKTKQNCNNSNIGI